MRLGGPASGRCSAKRHPQWSSQPRDHLKAIFAKTGVRSRSELVGQIFLEHYAPRWEDITGVPAGWLAKASPVGAGLR